MAHYGDRWDSTTTTVNCVIASDTCRIVCGRLENRFIVLPRYVCVFVRKKVWRSMLLLHGHKNDDNIASATSTWHVQCPRPIDKINALYNDIIEYGKICDVDVYRDGYDVYFSCEIKIDCFDLCAAYWLTGRHSILNRLLSAIDIPGIFGFIINIDRRFESSRRRAGRTNSGSTTSNLNNGHDIVRQC